MMTTRNLFSIAPLMLLAALVATGHFIAFFGLTAAIVLTLALLVESPSVEIARRIRRADRVAGMGVSFGDLATSERRSIARFIQDLASP